MFTSGAGTWSTAQPDDAGTATIAFGSCADDKQFPEQPIWGRMLARAPHALVLLGDTPYIDDGTVVVRRQRFREFFAVPAVAAALASIPTWTTWDDHDYATNDTFGDVAGSETARPVFVDYHAHASYGDGERGIYTSLRRGPIEVFLLDTRTFADRETMPMDRLRQLRGPPAQRSLLGARQMEWLQRGLLASTAPCKVLACGMVWNDAVRPGKNDCWGNWMAEREALFGWLSVHAIEGVLLVSGDVHRSRVFQHHSALGRVFPEFVTSPLAQKVIEANAVPGSRPSSLAFDAGEPSSCLLLRATHDRSTGSVSVRAEFVAGDGREFHVHEISAEDMQLNSGAAHRRAMALLRQAFGDQFAGMPAVEWMPRSPLPTLESVRGEAWRAAIARAQPAFFEWSRALALPRCRFGEGTAGEPGGEYVFELARLSAMRNVVAAKCMLAVADGDHEGLGQLVASLLAFARQLRHEPHPFAFQDANEIERQVVALQRWCNTLSDGNPLIVVRDRVREHLEKPSDVAACWQALRQAAQRRCDCGIERYALGDDRKASAARTRAAEVREHFLRWITPRFDAGAALLASAAAPQPTVPAFRQMPSISGPDELHVKGDADAGTAAVLGTWLASFVWRMHEGIPREYLDGLAELRAVAK